MAKKCIVLLAKGFEETEAVTCIDILRRGGIEVTVAGLNKLEITGSHEITVFADIRIDQAGEDFDCCLLPGGMPGATNLAGCEKVISLIKKMNSQGKIIAAICAAPAVVLAPAEILNKKSATCYPDMQDSFDNSTSFINKSVVVDGNIITSQGVGTALLFSLAVLEKLSGKQISEKVKKATLCP